MNRTEIEKQRREKLIKEKPYVMEKIFNYDNMRARGEATPVLEILYDYACNMSCTHCSNTGFKVKDRALTVKDMSEIARQADALGLAQFNISGGEPLVFPDLDQIIEAINPEKFHIAISTNGLLLDEGRAIHLKNIGVDKVKISVDSIDKEVYAQTRGQSDTFDQTFRALQHAKNAGLQVSAQTVVSHQTCISKNTEQLAAFCQEQGFNMDIIVARPAGKWQGREDVLIDQQDSQYLVNLSKKYPAVHRDTFPTYGDTCGRCGAVKRLICITKYGDVLPCIPIHISIGNIFEESLDDILKRGLKIKPLVTPNQLCLSGEDRNFIRKYMSKFYGKPLPLHWSEAFTKEDFIE